jgi:hypothetical protein
LGLDRLNWQSWHSKCKRLSGGLKGKDVTPAAAASIDQSATSHDIIDYQLYC